MKKDRKTEKEKTDSKTDRKVKCVTFYNRHAKRTTRTRTNTRTNESKYIEEIIILVNGKIYSIRLYLLYLLYIFYFLFSLT
jgi:hypothetical protein